MANRAPGPQTDDHAALDRLESHLSGLPLEFFLTHGRAIVVIESKISYTLGISSPNLPMRRPMSSGTLPWRHCRLARRPASRDGPEHW